MRKIPKSGEAGNLGNEVTLGDRLRRLRKEFRYSLEDLSKKTGLSKAFLHEIEKGKKDITSRRLLLISKVFRVSVDYLLTGEEPKPVELQAVEDYFEKVKSKILSDAGVKYQPMSKEEKEYLNKFRSLSPDKKEAITKTLDVLSEAEDVKKENP